MNRYFQRALSVMKQHPPLLGLILAVGFLGLALGYAEPSHPEPMPSPIIPPMTGRGSENPARFPEVVWKSVVPRLAQADDEKDKALDARIKQISDYFEERKKGAVPFAETMLGFESKFRVVGSLLQGIRDGAANLIHGEESNASVDVLKDFVKSRFRQYVLDPIQAKQVVDAATQGFLNDLKEINSRLIVDLNADLPDYPFDAVTSSSAELHAESHTIDHAAFVNTIVDGVVGDFVINLFLGGLAGPLSGAATAALAPEGLPVLARAATDLLANVGVEIGLGSAVTAVTGYDPQGGIVHNVGVALDRMCNSILYGDRVDFENYALLWNTLHGHPDPNFRAACVAPLAAMEQSAKLGVYLRLLKMSNDQHKTLADAVYKSIHGPYTCLPLDFFFTKTAPEELLSKESLEALIRQSKTTYGAGR